MKLTELETTDTLTITDLIDLKCLVEKQKFNIAVERVEASREEYKDLTKLSEKLRTILSEVYEAKYGTRNNK